MNHSQTEPMGMAKGKTLKDMVIDERPPHSHSMWLPIHL